MPLLQESQLPTQQRGYTKISEEKPTTLTATTFSHHQILAASAQTAAIMAAANGLSLHATFHPSLFNLWNPLPLSPPPATQQPTQTSWPQIKTPPKSPQNIVSSSSCSSDSIRSKPDSIRTKSDYDSSSPEVTNSKSFVCGVCSRAFGYKHVLQNHERTHTGEKPFECGECHKRFTRDHHLKTHMRLHTGERPYHCQHCDRQFVQVANLRRHLRVHTGEKPYTCGECGGRFSDSNQLKAHALIHKGEAAKFRRKSKCDGAVPPPGNTIIPDVKLEAEDLRVFTTTSAATSPLPEQTEPEDLSIKSGSERGSTPPYL